MQCLIGTENHERALARANAVALQLSRLLPSFRFVITAIPPRNGEPPMPSGSHSENYFSKQSESALRDREMDCAVHDPAAFTREAGPGIDYFCLPAPPGEMSAAMGLHNGLQQHTRNILENGLSPAADPVAALTFREGDSCFIAIRNLFIYPVLFAGAGIGRADFATLAVSRILQACEVCVYDTLIPEGLLELLPASAQRVHIGKRCGHHSVSQQEICHMLVRFAREGRRVVRLKGGDPTVFGRLAEEVAVLQKQSLPFQVLPGVGALSVAAASSGFLPTRRSSTRGFTLLTPRRKGYCGFAAVDAEERSRFPQIFYMASLISREVACQCLEEGFPPQLPVSLVSDAGLPGETVVSGSLADFASGAIRGKSGKPGLLMVGDIAAPANRFAAPAPLAGRRVLFCGCTNARERSREALERYGGLLIPLPMIQPEITGAACDCISALSGYDRLLVTSAVCARLLLNFCRQQRVDLRTMPVLMLCGNGTRAVFQEAGLYPGCILSEDGDIQGCAAVNLKGLRILRLCSDKDDAALSRRLQRLGASITESVFYRNIPVKYQQLPGGDAALFTSISAVEAFIDNFGPAAGKGCIACGSSPAVVRGLYGGTQFSRILTAVEATLPGMCLTLAAYWTAVRIRKGQEAFNAGVRCPEYPS